MTITTATQSTGWVADATTFGARLALIRQRMAWGNVAEAAKACGVPIASWRNWERDNREPHRLTTVAKQISGVTGCDYLWLVHGPDRGEGGSTLRFARDPLADRLVAVATEPANRPANRRTRPVTRPARPLVTAVAA